MQVHSIRKFALLAATKSGNTETVAVLLAHGANPNVLDEVSTLCWLQNLTKHPFVFPSLQYGKTALDIAVEHEQWEMFELLVGKGAMSGEGMPEKVSNINCALHVHPNLISLSLFYLLCACVTVCSSIMPASMVIWIWSQPFWTMGSMWTTETRFA